MKDRFKNKDIAGSAEKFARVLLDNPNLRNNIKEGICLALETKNKTPIAKLICSKLNMIGRKTNQGMGVAVKALNSWGETINRLTFLSDKETWVFFEKVFWSLATELLDQGEVECDEKNKSATQSFVKQVADQACNEFISLPIDSLQESSIIAFQDGYLDLDQNNFITGVKSIFNFSNVTDCSWRSDIADEFCSKNLSELIATFCHNLRSRLEDWFPDDPSTHRIIFRIFGYLMTTDNSKQVFFLMFGPGGSGKGSLAKIISSIIGPTNYTNLSFGALEEKFALADTRHRTLAIIDEANGDKKETTLRLNVIKRFTGGNSVQYERKYAHPEIDEVSAKFLFQANKTLEFTDEGRSIMDRMVALGFENSFRGKENSNHNLVAEVLVDANAIATLAALEWASCRNEVLPFKLEGSRALRIGEEQILEENNPQALAYGKYIKIDKDSELTTEKIISFNDAINSELTEDYNHRLMNEPRTIAKIIKEVKGKQFVPVKLTCGKRGYKGLAIDHAAFLADYPQVAAIFQDRFPDLDS